MQMKEITINNTKYPYPPNFTLNREEYYANEVTTMEGETIRDLVGYRYADTSLNWGGLPQSKIRNLAALSGEFSVTFKDLNGASRIIKAVKKSITGRETSSYDANGEIIWADVSLELSFPGCFQIDQETELHTEG